MITATNGREAVDQFAEKADEIDLVILDVTMPQLSGIAAGNEICSIRRDVKVVLVSGYNDPVNLDSVDLPTSHFLQKPYQLDELRGLLQQLFAQS